MKNAPLAAIAALLFSPVAANAGTIPMTTVAGVYTLAITMTNGAAPALDALFPSPFQVSLGSGASSQAEKFFTAGPAHGTHEQDQRSHDDHGSHGEHWSSGGYWSEGWGSHSHDGHWSGGSHWSHDGHWSDDWGSHAHDGHWSDGGHRSGGSHWSHGHDPVSGMITAAFSFTGPDAATASATGAYTAGYGHQPVSIVWDGASSNGPSGAHGESSSPGALILPVAFADGTLLDITLDNAAGWQPTPEITFSLAADPSAGPPAGLDPPGDPPGDPSGATPGAPLGDPPTDVPEPGSLALFATGLLGLGVVFYRKRRE